MSIATVQFSAGRSVVRMSFFGRQTFLVQHSIYGWQVTTLLVNC